MGQEFVTMTVDVDFEDVEVEVVVDWDEERSIVSGGWKPVARIERVTGPGGRDLTAEVDHDEVWANLEALREY